MQDLSRDATSPSLASTTSRPPRSWCAAPLPRPTEPSARSDRRRTRRARPARDEVAIPIEAVFGHSLERRIVDVDDPEPFRVTVRPLEVVEQAPDEVPLDRRAFSDRTGDGADVRLEIGRSLGIVHAPVVHAHVAERGAVLGDIDRRRPIVTRDTDEQMLQTVRIDLPAHIRVLRLGIALHPWAISAGTHDEAEVVVDAEEVQRRGDRLEIAVSYEGRDGLVALEEIRRIRTAEDRVEEPAVPFAVDLPRRRFVLRRLGRGVGVTQVERDPNACVRGTAPDLLRSPSVRQQQMMRCGDRVGLARTAGSVFAPSMPDPGMNPRLVVRDPVTDAVAETAHDGLRVLDERFRGRTL